VSDRRQAVIKGNIMVEFEHAEEVHTAAAAGQIGAAAGLQLS
jgi:hypothetical protein